MLCVHNSIKYADKTDSNFNNPEAKENGVNIQLKDVDITLNICGKA